MRVAEGTGGPACPGGVAALGAGGATFAVERFGLLALGCGTADRPCACIAGALVSTTSVGGAAPNPAGRSWVA
jgi:hypothetical protein